MRKVAGLKGTEYSERLREFTLDTLEERRHQADMHMMHKVMHSDSGLDPDHWFKK